MLRSPAIAAIAFACAGASPLMARSPSTKVGFKAIPIHVAIAPAPATSLAVTERVAPDAALFDGAERGLSLSSRTFRMDDGGSAIRKGLVGSWSIVRGLNAGVGLFSVTHENQKEPEFRRNWTAKNVYPRSRRVAAVGLSMGF